MNLKTKLAATALLVLMTVLSFLSMYKDSAIVDEIAHIPAGYAYVKLHDYRLNPEHPPLAKAAAAFPLLFLDPTFPTELDDWNNKVNGQWEMGWKFLYERGNDADQILLWSRIPMLGFMIVLGIYVLLWGRRLFNDKAAIAALFLYALSPLIIAHSRFVTTDVVATLGVVMGMYHYLKFIKDPSWGNFWGATAAFTIAQLLKYTSFILFPLFAMIAVFAIIARKEVFVSPFLFSQSISKMWLKKTVVYLGSFILMSLFSVVGIAVVYQVFMYATPLDVQLLSINEILWDKDFFRNTLTTLTENPITRSFSWYLLGLIMVFTRVTGGNVTFFLGQVSNESFRLFYPVAFLLKTPITTIILSIIATVTAAITVHKFSTAQFQAQATNTKEKVKNLWNGFMGGLWDNLGIVIGVGVIFTFFVTGILGNLNIGLRHIMPAYPFLFIFSGGVVAYIANVKGGGWVRTGRVLTVLMLAGYMISNLIAFPHYLSYFNESIGKNEGYKYLTDSNTDWGQDLRRLADYVDENNIQSIKVDYFGGGVAKYYMGGKAIDWKVKNGPTTGWIAVSATFFQNSKYYSSVEPIPDYSWLEQYEPEAVIGGSILVFNIPENK